MEDPRRHRPWYREPWPWILMAGPAATVVAGFWTLALAIKSDDGLVASDYYRRGLAINRTLERGDRARRLGLDAIVAISGDRVRVVLRGREAPPATLRLALIHPTQAGHDQTVALQEEAPGVYRGEIVPFGSQRRLIHLEDDRGTWRLSGEWIPGGGSAALGAND